MVTHELKSMIIEGIFHVIKVISSVKCIFFLMPIFLTPGKKKKKKWVFVVMGEGPMHPPGYVFIKINYGYNWLIYKKKSIYSKI